MLGRGVCRLGQNQGRPTPGPLGGAGPAPGSVSQDPQRAAGPRLEPLSLKDRGRERSPWRVGWA